MEHISVPLQAVLRRSNTKCCNGINCFSIEPFPLTCTGRSGFVPRRFPILSHYARQRGDPFDIIPSITVVGDGGSQFQICTHSCTIFNWSRIKARFPGIFCKTKLPTSLPVWYNCFQIVDNDIVFDFSCFRFSLKHITNTSTTCGGLSFQAFSQAAESGELFGSDSGPDHSLMLSSGRNIL